ncbi:MAG: hypothetical protein ISR48_01275 [Alphaproteobacteria bacterium]|nr:hypothetical protein [Alphaproteobacteria bacterium]
MAGIISLEQIVPMVLSEGINLLGSAVSSRGGSSSAQQGLEAERQASVDRIRRAEDIERRNRRDKLRRALATSRARLGSQGVGSSRGSGEAVLLGLIEETDEDDKDSAELARGDINDINRRFRRNLLQAAEAKSRDRFDILRRLPSVLNQLTGR